MIQGISIRKVKVNRDEMFFISLFTYQIHREYSGQYLPPKNIFFWKIFIFNHEKSQQQVSFVPDTDLMFIALLQ